MPRTCFVCGALTALALLCTTPVYSAGIGSIVFTGGTGSTVYGASPYCCVDPGAPTYIGNNVTGLNDILSSPGNGYQTANPVVGNNVAQSGFPVAAPYAFAWTGGASPGGNFGSGITVDAGPAIGFALNDTTVGCCTASYMITSVFDTFQVQGGNYTGNLGSYLAIGGVNLTGADASVASEVVEYSFNNPNFVAGNFIALAPMVLAASGNCVTSVARGGSGAAMVNAACGNGGNGGAYRGLAIDNFFVNNLPVGTTIQVVATITAYSDPSSVDSIIPDAELLGDTGTTLPDFALADTAVAAPAPEPGTMALFGAALAGLAYAGRRRKRRL